MTAGPLLVVMGVAGAGKSTLARALARELGLAVAEGDDLHPAENIEKMRAGIALSDADRAPWLARVADWLAAHRDSGGVIACSALRRRYRDRLRLAAPATVFIHPVADRDTLRGRLAERTGHFMPASLLDSQLATLEPLADEPGFTVDATLAPDRLVATVRALLAAPQDARSRT